MPTRPTTDHGPITSLLRPFAVAIITLSFVAGVVQTSSAATGGTGPDIVVTPSTGLVDRQTVSVQVSGFAPGALIEIVECSSPVDPGTLPAAIDSNCEFETGPDGGNPDMDISTGATCTTDAAGACSADVIVRTVAVHANGPNVDCRTAQCALAAFDRSGQEWTYLDIHFEGGTGGTSGPVLTGASRASGPKQGRTEVVLEGTDLGDVTVVWFGDAPAAFVVDSDDQITAVAPRHQPGTVQITVASASGDRSAGVPYTYCRQFDKKADACR